MSDPASDDAPWIDCELIYVGPCVLNGGKLGFSYLDDATGKEWNFTGSISGGRCEPPIGAVYSTQYRGTKLRLGAKWVRQLRDDPRLAGMQAHTIVVRAHFAEKKAIAAGKDRENMALFKGLDPIRKRYREAPAFARATLIAEAIAYIMRG